MMFLLFSCSIHKVVLTGVVDYADDHRCTVELTTNDVIVITAPACAAAKEGDKITFYARRKRERR
jgi:hypothetical protein